MTAFTNAQTSTEIGPVAGAGGALAGLRVLEIGSLIAGPFAGRLLGDHGADVIKVEPPNSGDPLRSWGQVIEDGRGFFWTVHARNKRCITLDLRRRKGRDIFLSLAASSDVVIESFRPGTLERWDLGFDQLQECNPGLVLARVSGYGQTGPRSKLAGYASMAESVAGIRFITGFPGEPPVRMALSLGDSVAGMFAMQGILSALIARGRTGRGQVVDVALTESCLALTESMIPDYSRSGLIRQPSGTRLTGIAPSNAFLTSDGRWVIVAANQDTVFARLCHAMERPELVADPRFKTHQARAEHQDVLDDLIAKWVVGLAQGEALRRLDEADVVAGPVNTVADVVRDEQFCARDMIIPHYDEGVSADVDGPGIVPRLCETPGGMRWAGPPQPGWHNEEVYSSLLGYDETILKELRRDGII